ncbi:hypothetical protein HOY82DRAFT_534905 [Tuber indicum]|nr:hypothetical protein HOY82DRAFT_534905 [Tuber indicum]
MSFTFPYYEYPYIPTTSTTLPISRLRSKNSCESFITPDKLVTEVSSPPPFSLLMSHPSSSNTFNMSFPEGDISLGDGYLDEIRPEDSVSQTFHYLDSQHPITTQVTQIMEIDEDIDDNRSSVLSAPPSSLLTDSVAYSHATETGEPSLEISNPDTSHLPSCFLAKRKRRTGYCWLPCNGIEFYDKRSEAWRWKCAHCNFSPLITLL